MGCIPKRLLGYGTNRVVEVLIHLYWRREPQMGLQDFNVAPDNKGGRKKKEKSDEDNGRDTHGNPADLSWDREQWLSVYNKYCPGGHMTPEAMGEICHHTHYLESSVKFFLTDYEIHEFEEVKQQYPVYFGLTLPSKQSTSQKETSSTDGIFSLVDDAKD